MHPRVVRVCKCTHEEASARTDVSLISAQPDTSSDCKQTNLIAGNQTNKQTNKQTDLQPSLTEAMQNLTECLTIDARGAGERNVCEAPRRGGGWGGGEGWNGSREFL